MSPDLEFKIDKTTKEDLHEYFKIIDNTFNPPISSRIALDVYAERLANLSRRVELWEDDRLVGILAVYINADDKRSAFAAMYSILPEFRGDDDIQVGFRFWMEKLARQADFDQILCEVYKENIGLINYYESGGFKKIKDKDENFIYMALSLR